MIERNLWYNEFFVRSFVKLDYKYVKYFFFCFGIIDVDKKVWMVKSMRKLMDMNVEYKVVKDFFFEIIYMYKNIL